VAVCFYRAMLRGAQYCYGKLSVCQSVTLRYRDHVGWKSSKIVSHLGPCSVFATQISWIYSKVNTCNFRPNRGGVRKSGFQSTKSSNISDTRQDRTSLLLKTNRKSYMHFLLVPKSMTLDDLEGSLCTPLHNTCVFRSSK